ncbi:MAG: hypothetical protein DDT33_01363 [Firmicutes bacterium]|nr:hypothetical protein [Bacillota bacterium]
MTETKVKQLVTFCILMENHEGVTGKAPSYIIEKYEKCLRCTDQELESLLDTKNRRKYIMWKNLWNRK